MWTYRQCDGWLLNSGGVKIAQGYAGRGIGKNNPTMQEVHGVGPVPCGFFTIGAPADTELHGPYVLPLEPDPGNEMFGRSGFLLHGERLHGEIGHASNGCVILPRWTRERIWESGDHRLQVVSGLPVTLMGVEESTT